MDDVSLPGLSSPWNLTPQAQCFHIDNIAMLYAMHSVNSESEIPFVLMGHVSKTISETSAHAKKPKLGEEVR